MTLKKNLQLNWNDLSRFKGELYGICALWIMIFHSYLVGIGYTGESPILRVLYAVIDRGNMGVDIFLFLSGVFLYFSYSAHEGDLGRFISRRIVRLILPVMVVYLPYWIYHLVGEDNLFQFLIKVSTSEFWINGSQTIWFVSLILLCYFLYPYIYTFYFKGKRQEILRPAVLIAGVMVLTYAAKKAAWTFYTDYEIALTRIPMFLLGSYCGRLVKEQKPLKWWVTPLAYLSVCICAVVFAKGLMPGGMWTRYFYIYSGLSFLTVFTHLLKCIPWKWLHRILKFFGGISLECYLANIMLIRVYKSSGFYVRGSIVSYGILLILSVVLAYATGWLCGKLQGIGRRARPA